MWNIIFTMSYDLVKAAHSVYSLCCHFIYVLKYRREIFVNTAIKIENKHMEKIKELRSIWRDNPEIKPVGVGTMTAMTTPVVETGSSLHWLEGDATLFPHKVET